MEQKLCRLLGTFYLTMETRKNFCRLLSLSIQPLGRTPTQIILKKSTKTLYTLQPGISRFCNGCRIYNFKPIEIWIKTNVNHLYEVAIHYKYLLYPHQNSITVLDLKPPMGYGIVINEFFLTPFLENNTITQIPAHIFPLLSKKID